LEAGQEGGSDESRDIGPFRLDETVVPPELWVHGRREPARDRAGTATAQAGRDAPPARDKTIGIQVGAVSFVDEGVEEVLSILQERGRVNTIYLAAFTYGRGLAGRQVPGQPFPDHGVPSSDAAFFHGGNYARPHPHYCRDTILSDMRLENLAAAGRAVREGVH
jgi:hypothetical protein